MKRDRMKCPLYLAIDAIWSFILSSLIWYLVLSNASFDFYHNSDNTLAGVILVAGFVIYLVLTASYIVFGYKKVAGWRWPVAVFAILICILMGFLGMFGAAVPELIMRG